MITEEWRDIHGYEGLYQVSNLGRVKSLKIFKRKTTTILKLNNSIKYVTVGLCKNSIVETVYVGRLVLEAFVGPCPEGMECCHNNSIPIDNRVENLRWDTHSNNLKDKILNGTYQYGEKNSGSKLTWDDVFYIREELRIKTPQKILADKFNVSVATISYIGKYKTWIQK